MNRAVKRIFFTAAPASIEGHECLQATIIDLVRNISGQEWHALHWNMERSRGILALQFGKTAHQSIKCNQVPRATSLDPEARCPPAMHWVSEALKVIVARTSSIIQFLHLSITGDIDMNGKTDWNGCTMRKEKE